MYQICDHAIIKILYFMEITTWLAYCIFYEKLRTMRIIVLLYLNTKTNCNYDHVYCKEN